MERFNQSCRQESPGCTAHVFVDNQYMTPEEAATYYVQQEIMPVEQVVYVQSYLQENLRQRAVNQAKGRQRLTAKSLAH